MDHYKLSIKTILNSNREMYNVNIMIRRGCRSSLHQLMIPRPGLQKMRTASNQFNLSGTFKVLDKWFIYQNSRSQ
jgi:hypothetical protein